MKTNWSKNQEELDGLTWLQMRDQVCDQIWWQVCFLVEEYLNEN